MNTEKTIADNLSQLTAVASVHRGGSTGDWRCIRSGEMGEAFVGRIAEGSVSSESKCGESESGESPISSLVELRVLPTLAADDVALLALRSQFRLIEIANHPCIRSVVSESLDDNPPSLMLSLPYGLDPQTCRLPNVLGNMTGTQRLQLSACLVDTFATAHNVGLTHGRLRADDVLIRLRGKDSFACAIDFTGVHGSVETLDNPSTGLIDEGESDYETDLRNLRELILYLLEPVVAQEHDSVDAKAFGNRERVCLKQLIDGTDRLRESEAPPLTQWREFLEHWLPTMPSGAITVADASEDVPTGEFDDNDSRYTATVDSDSTGQMAAGTFAPDGGLDYDVVVQPTDTNVPEQLGRFRIGSMIGKGGMGTVYRGIDLADDSPVAIKVLRLTGSDIARSVRRFRKEARLLADAQNEFVTRLIEVGEDSGHHFLAMELVEGIDLKSWFASKTHLDEMEALGVVGDIAKALVDAHAREVIHRDIKPENVLLQFIGNVEGGVGDGDGDSKGKYYQNQPLSDFRVKLTDFGIARHINQSSSMEMTAAGMILGTPRYMSPEQFDGDAEIRPTTDVYALGVTLYELLTGEAPFKASEMSRLAAMHRHKDAPSVQKTRSEISDLTARIVDRALAKDPALRYGDASQILSAIQRVLCGEPVSMQSHPATPERAGANVWDKSKSWDMDSSPSDLWHHVSNTDRLNHALGFPAVTYRTEKDPQRGLRKFGSFQMAGMTIAWEEHPFEWIEGQRMGVLREFTSGPFEWFLSTVTLEPIAGGGSRLTHRVRIQPRSLVGRMLTTIEADWKGFRNLDRVYKRIDRAIGHRLSTAEGTDPFAPPAPITNHQRDRLKQRLEWIITDGVSPDVAAKLGMVVGQWPSQEIAQLRPLRLADALGIKGQTMIDACLIAASRGLLTLRWDILCPTCRAPASTSNQLADIAAHTGCDACDVEFQSNIGNAIEMVFRVHPEIREVDDLQYCIGGPAHSPHVVAQVRIEPGERLVVPIDLISGDYLLRGPRLPRTQPIRVRDTHAPMAYETGLTRLGQSVHVPVLRRGQQTITLTNDSQSLHVVRLERMIARDDVVTATAAATMAKFRQLFPNQSFATENPVSTEQVTLMATSINNIDVLYSDLGDTQAYQVTHDLLKLATDLIADLGGTVTKTMGERTLAAFRRREQAVMAALRIRDQWRSAANVKALTRSLEIGIGIHSGPTLVTTENDRLDYFGSTVRAVIALAEKAGGDTFLTHAVSSDPEVIAILPRDDQVETVVLPGLAQTRVRRLSSNANQ